MAAPGRRWKITLAGRGGVGKTSCSVRFVHNLFEDEHDPTLYDQLHASVAIDGEHVDIVIEEDGAQEESQSKWNRFRTSSAIYFVYSAGDPRSFEDLVPLKASIDEIRQSTAYPCVIVANKTDIKNEHSTDITEAKKLAQAWGSAFFEVSAKENIGVADSFQYLVGQLIQTAEYQNSLRTGNRAGKCCIQ